MNKKAYIAPEMEVVNVEIEALMLAASEGEGEGYDTEEAGFVQRGGERRGSWGNFWN